MLLGGGLLGGGLAAAYRHDLKQLQFDAATAAGPLLRLLDPETAHNVGLRVAAAGLFPQETRPDPPRLATQAWGRQLTNPFGERAPVQCTGGCCICASRCHRCHALC